MASIYSDMEQTSVQHHGCKSKEDSNTGETKSSPEVTFNGMTLRNFVSVSTYFINGKMVTILPDAYQVIVKTWGSSSSFQSLLRKQGVETGKFTPSELRRLKMIGAVDQDVKVCSFIDVDSFVQVLQKYDQLNNTENFAKIQLLPPIEICEGANNGGQETSASSKGTNGQSHLAFSLSFTVLQCHEGLQDLVCLSEVKNVFDSHYRRPELFYPFLKSLKILKQVLAVGNMEVPFGSESNKEMQKLLITRKDVERIMWFTSAFLGVDLPEITWTSTEKELGNLDTQEEAKPHTREISKSLSPSTSSNEGDFAKLNTDTHSGFLDHCNGRAALEKETSACNSFLFQGGSQSSTSYSSPVCNRNTSPSSSLSSSSSSSSSSLSPLVSVPVIRTCQVDGKVVVCIPDLHKIVIELYGQSVQVGYYMQRLGINRHRFDSVHLKCLKAHNVLSLKATVCTYITKEDAERLLKMYDECNAQSKFYTVKWSKPIFLEEVVQETCTDQISATKEENPFQEIGQDEIKIVTFIINKKVFVSMPDVHRVVQFLNGESVQLHYNLDKLGIVKHKFSYSQVYRLKAVSDIKRPSICTFITKTDVDKLLQYYATPETRSKLRLIQWLPATALNDSNQTLMPVNTENTCGILTPEVLHCESGRSGDNAVTTLEDYSISDLYKAFVGDDVESVNDTISRSANNEDHQSLSPLCSTGDSNEQASYNDCDNVPQCAVTRNDFSSDIVTCASIVTTVAQPSDNIKEQELVIPQSQYLPVNSLQSEVCTTELEVAKCTAQVFDFDCVNCGMQSYSSNPTSEATCTTLLWSHPHYQPVSRHSTTSNTAQNVCCKPHMNMHGTVTSVPWQTASTVHGCHYHLHGNGQRHIGRSHFSSPVATRRGECWSGCKRPYDNSDVDVTSSQSQTKQYKADSEDMLKTLERKDIEMKFLYDAYQENVKRERELRQEIEMELEQVKVSNAELLQNLQRKESEMKILHDSYKLQIDLERNKREDLEHEIVELKGRFGIIAKTPPVKQERI